MAWLKYSDGGVFGVLKMLQMGIEWARQVAEGKALSGEPWEFICAEAPAAEWRHPPFSSGYVG